MHSHLARWRAICGRLATGAGGRRATTGFRACGSRRRASAYFGPRAIGDSQAACMAGTPVTGVHMLDSMAALITDSDMGVSGSGEGDGLGDASPTTRLS